MTKYKGQAAQFFVLYREFVGLSKIYIALQKKIIDVQLIQNLNKCYIAVKNIMQLRNYARYTLLRQNEQICRKKSGRYKKKL